MFINVKYVDFVEVRYLDLLGLLVSSDKPVSLRCTSLDTITMWIQNQPDLNPSSLHFLAHISHKRLLTVFRNIQKVVPILESTDAQRADQKHQNKKRPSGCNLKPTNGAVALRRFVA